MVLGSTGDARDALVLGVLGEGVVTERAAEATTRALGTLWAVPRRRQNVRDRACGAAAANMRVGTGLRASATSMRRR